MLSIGKLVAGAEAYYLRTVASGFEEYYTGSGEAPGVWVGSGTAELGLAGEVAEADLASVLRGLSPSDGRSLGSTTACSRRVAGFDLTFSAPKSVSLLYGLGTEEMRLAVTDAHDEALSAAISYLESHAAFARRGAGGSRQVLTSGLVAAAFRHRTSRAGDPQLHTHVLVANLVRASDGRWSSLHAALLYHQARTAGFVYQAVLRCGLTRRLGVGFGPVRNGCAEIVGISPALIRAFSTRRQEVEARLGELGASSARAAELAALGTRRPKWVLGAERPETDKPGLREHWQARARELGYDPDEARHVLGTPREPTVGANARDRFAESLLGPGGLTLANSTFERRDVVRAVAAWLVAGGTLDTIEALATAVTSDGRVVVLGGTGHGGEPLLTTRELLSLERALVSTATGATGLGAGVAIPSAVESALAARREMSSEQLEMVRRLTSSGHGVEVVIGKAGAGKTYALDAARAAWHRSGLVVQGVSLAARAAAELEAGAGIPSGTITSFLNALDHGELFLGRRDVLVVDEAGMVGTRVLHRLVGEAIRAGAKVVLVGDPCQLPEIEAGGTLRLLAQSLGSIELKENRRQDEVWERAALEELREGDPATALVAYTSHGRVHLTGSAREARTALVLAWAASRSSGEESAMYALRRSDVEELNDLARIELRRLGSLGADVFYCGERGYAVGDEVLCLRNDPGIGVLNGTRGSVSAAGFAGLEIETASGRRSLPFRYVEDGHLAFGYASTVHKAQGTTVGRAFVLAGDALYREAGYVAMSRARTGTDLFVVTSAFDADGDGVGHDQPSLLDEFSRSRAKRLALESLEPMRLKKAVCEESRLRSELDGLRWQGTEARRPRDDARTCAAAQHDEELALRLAELELADRVRSRLLGELSAIEPPKHLTALLGEPPASGLGRARWVEAAGGIEAYRRRFGVTDISSTLGAEPADADQLAFRAALVHSLRFMGREFSGHSLSQGRSL